MNISEVESDKKAINIIRNVFKKSIKQIDEECFEYEDYSKDFKALLNECGLIELNDDGSVISKRYEKNLNSDVLLRITFIVSILDYCEKKGIDLKSDSRSAQELLNDMRKDEQEGIPKKNGEDYSREFNDALKFLKLNEEMPIATLSTMQEYKRGMGIVTGNIDVEPGKRVNEKEKIAIFDYATPIIIDRLPIKGDKKLYESLVSSEGYYDFWNKITTEITKLSNEIKEKNDDVKEIEEEELSKKEKGKLEEKKLEIGKLKKRIQELQEIRKTFEESVEREVLITIKTFTTQKFGLSMDARRNKMQKEKLSNGLSDKLGPLLYTERLPAQNFEELLSSAVYQGAIKKYYKEIGKPQTIIEANLSRKRFFNAYTEMRSKFGLVNTEEINQFISKGRNIFLFERFMGNRFEYEYEKINIAKQLEAIKKAYPGIERDEPVVIFRAGVLNEDGSMTAKEREQTYSPEQHVYSGSRISTSYLSCTESPLIMGQYLYSYNSKSAKTVPTVIDVRKIYNQLLKRYQELNQGKFKFEKEDEFLNALEEFVLTNENLTNPNCIKLIQNFRENNKDAVLYERDLDHTEGFIPRKDVERMKNNYSKISAEVLIRGIIPSEAITEMDSLTSDIFQKVCRRKEIFEYSFDASAKRNHNIIGELTEFLSDEQNLERLNFEDYEIDFIRQYYIKGKDINDIILLPEDDETAKERSSTINAIGAEIRNNITDKLIKDEMFATEYIGIPREELVLLRNTLQKLYGDNMRKTSKGIDFSKAVARDERGGSALYRGDKKNFKEATISQNREKKDSRSINITNYGRYPFKVEHKAANAVRELKDIAVIYCMDSQDYEHAESPEERE